MIRVAVVYRIWPHYRSPVLDAMLKSEAVRYTFLASGEAADGIEHAAIQQEPYFRQALYRNFGPLLWQPDAVKVALEPEYDAVLYLGNPNFIGTWLGAIICRLRGRPCLFWAHGWLRHESGAKRFFRHRFFRLANHLLVYAERAKKIGTAEGFPADRITVIYNSLDVAKSRALVGQIEQGQLNSVNPRLFFDDPDRPLIICTARITSKVRLDLLFDAATELKRRGRPINILLVGDGPERERLQARAVKEGLAVHFFGACYDESVVAQLIYHSDLTVSPGKIGLTAMHTLMYGTPAITHGDFDLQMPEVEAIEPGISGAFFKEGNAADLADAIDQWLSGRTNKAAVKAAAFKVIDDKWNPETQARIIEAAILGVARSRTKGRAGTSRA